jgi:hypothetical protein
MHYMYSEVILSGGHDFEEQEMLVEGPVTGTARDNQVYLFDIATSGARMRQPHPG